MKVAFFDAKPYDIPGFNRYVAGTDLEIKYFESHLNEDTVSLAAGFDAVCVFVNDIVNEKVVNRLYEFGVRVIVLRCAGFNNVCHLRVSSYTLKTLLNAKRTKHTTAHANSISAWQDSPALICMEKLWVLSVPVKSAVSLPISAEVSV